MLSAAELIRELIAHGLSQSDIARATGIPQPRLSRWASDGAPIGADDALRLAQLHRTTVVPQSDVAASPATAEEARDAA
jgi:transcriptional regulator with XRE-family HTH domain